MSSAQARFLRVPYPDDGRPFGDGVFPTPSGKVQLVSDALAPWANRRCRPSSPPPRSAAGNPSWPNGSRLQLMTPKHHTRFLNGSYSHLPGHGGREAGPFLELCADDATVGRGRGPDGRVFNDRAVCSCR